MGNSASTTSNTSKSSEPNSLTPRKASINDLSLEVLANVFKYLSVKDQRELARTSKKNQAAFRQFSLLVVVGLAKSDDRTVKRALTTNPNITQLEHDQITSVPLLTLAKEHRKLLNAKQLDCTKIERQETLQAYRRKLFSSSLDGNVRKLIKVPGNRMASISYNDPIKIWDSHTGALTHTQRGSYLTALAIATEPDDKVLLVGAGYNNIQIWDLKTGVLIRTLDNLGTHVLIRTLDGCGTYILKALPPEPDGQILLASATIGSIKIWDLNSGALLINLPETCVRAVQPLHPGPDGKVLMASANDTLKIWDPHTGALIHTLVGHTSSVISLEGLLAKKDGKVLLASGSLDNTIKIWDPPMGTLIDTLDGHTSAVMALQALHPGPNDEVLLASGSNDKTVKIWNVGTGECLHTIAVESPIWSLMYDAGVLRAGLENGKIVSIHFKGVDLDALLGPDPTLQRSGLKL